MHRVIFTPVHRQLAVPDREITADSRSDPTPADTRGTRGAYLDFQSRHSSCLRTRACRTDHAGAAPGTSQGTVHRDPGRLRLAPMPPPVDDCFFREMVSSMRNGVLAITSDGAVAVMNAEAYRIFGVTADPTDIGRPYTEVLRDSPRRGARARLRLRADPSAQSRRDAVEVHGPRDRLYAVARPRRHGESVTGIALFFKDLTRVEQLEERERLRDRLAALGEMAAAIAHELKNPLAGIEVMAGLLRRKVLDSPDAQSILTDIINEAKMANATVVEVLDYVRPVRLETERTSSPTSCRRRLLIAEGKAPRGTCRCTRAFRATCRHCTATGISSARCSPTC